MATPSRHASHPNQLEFKLEIAPSPSFSVQRLASGDIVLKSRPMDLWISTEDAGLMLRRSARWVRMLCESEVIKARKLPGSKRWDVDSIALQEWIDSGAADRLKKIS